MSTLTGLIFPSDEIGTGINIARGLGTVRLNSLGSVVFEVVAVVGLPAS